MLKPRNFLKLGALFAVLILGHAKTAAATCNAWCSAKAG